MNLFFSRPSPAAVQKRIECSIGKEILLTVRSEKNCEAGKIWCWRCQQLFYSSCFSLLRSHYLHASLQALNGFFPAPTVFQKKGGGREGGKDGFGIIHPYLQSNFIQHFDFFLQRSLMLYSCWIIKTKKRTWKKYLAAMRQESNIGINGLVGRIFLGSSFDGMYFHLCLLCLNCPNP